MQLLVQRDLAFRRLYELDPNFDHHALMDLAQERLTSRWKEILESSS